MTSIPSSSYSFYYFQTAIYQDHLARVVQRPHRHELLENLVRHAAAPLLHVGNELLEHLNRLLLELASENLAALVPLYVASIQQTANQQTA